MRKLIKVSTHETLRSLAFDYNAPIYIEPELLSSEETQTDSLCDELLIGLSKDYDDIIVFFIHHEGFRIYFALRANFVILKQYMIDKTFAVDLKKLFVYSVNFDWYTKQWSAKRFYNYKRTHKADNIKRSFGYFIATYPYVHNKTFVSEVKVSDDYLYLVDMTFCREGREITLRSLANDYPKIVSDLQKRINSIENYSNNNKAIRAYLPIIDMILI
jgi:hypothetical protein